MDASCAAVFPSPKQALSCSTLPRFVFPQSPPKRGLTCSKTSCLSDKPPKRNSRNSRNNNERLTGVVGVPAPQGLPEPALLPAGEVPRSGAAAPASPSDGRRDRPRAGYARADEGGAAGLHRRRGDQRARCVGGGGVCDVSGLGREGEEAVLQEEKEGDAKVGEGVW